MNPKGHFVFFFLVIFLAAACFCDAGPATNLPSYLESAPPFLELRAAAKYYGIPLDGFTASGNSRGLAPGDSLTALITLHQKGNRRTQWLVYFQIIALSKGPSSKGGKPYVAYSALGNKLEFSNSPATFRIRAIGPYEDAGSFWGQPVPKAKYAHANINRGFLGVGMDKAAATVYRISRYEEKTGNTNFEYWFSQKPPPVSQAIQNKKIAAQIHMTPQEERALTVWYPALWSYFNAVGETPNLESILWKVTSLPSMWSIIKHAGVTAWISVDARDIHPVSLPDWNLPAHETIYTLPLHVSLNQQPALYATLLVADPRPPLLACGGIVGFLAQNPDDAENYMTLRIISASCGTDAAAKAANDRRKQR